MPTCRGATATKYGKRAGRTDCRVKPGNDEQRVPVLAAHFLRARVCSIRRHCEERSDEAIQCGVSDRIAPITLAMMKQRARPRVRTEKEKQVKGRTTKQDAERRHMHTLLPRHGNQRCHSPPFRAWRGLKAKAAHLPAFRCGTCGGEPTPPLSSSALPGTRLKSRCCLPPPVPVQRPVADRS